VGAKDWNIKPEISCGKNLAEIKTVLEKAMRFFKSWIFKNGSG